MEQVFSFVKNIKQSKTKIFICLEVNNIKQDQLINEQIRFREVQVIDEQGNKLGKMNTHEAIDLAEGKDLDLVLVSSNPENPVCKLMDYGKYKFEQSKREKESKKKQKVVDVKEIRLSSTIDTHDFEFKAKNAKKFLEDGNKVKATIKFKGRELNNTTFGSNVLKKFAEALEEVGSVDKEPKLEGRSMMLMINPKNVK